jgi:tRNA A-37 threonylcarbamoyl transferase component Bud32
MFDDLRLSDLPRRQISILREATGTRPAIRLISDGDRRAIVKDFSANTFIFRNVAGRFLIWREAKAYRRLKGLQGVPTLYRIIDGLALLLEAIPGNDLETLQGVKKLDHTFFSALKDLVDRCHRRGVAHCDLKRAPNTILGEDGRPYIVDWSASICATEFRLFPLTRIYARFLRDDYLAIVKLRLSYAPESVSDGEKRAYYERSRVERAVRDVRDRLRELLQKLA